MRKLFVHPVTAMLLSAALLLGLKEQFGIPRTGFLSLAFVAVFAYACNMIFVVMFYASKWPPVIRKLEFPGAWKNEVFRFGMAMGAFSLNVTVGAAAAIFVFGADPATVARVCAPLLAISAAAATIPVSREPTAASAP